MRLRPTAVLLTLRTDLPADPADPSFLSDSGGGLSNVQKQVLQIMENGGDEQQQLPGEDLTPQSVRKQLLALEKAVNKNRDLRTKYPTEPEKCVHLLLLLASKRAPLLFSSSLTLSARTPLAFVPAPASVAI